MAVTAQEISAELSRLGFGCWASDDPQLTGIINAALRDVNAYKPRISFASFPTKAATQDYLIFDPDDEITGGVCASAIEIRNVMWATSGTVFDWDTLPEIQVPLEQILRGHFLFDRPGDVEVFRQKMSSWARHFGQQSWELYGDPGDATAFIRLAPIPSQDGMLILVEMAAGYALDEITGLMHGIGRNLMQWVKVEAAQANANKYSHSAGTEFEGFSVGKDTHKYWERQETKYRRQALASQGGDNAGLVGVV